MTRISDVAVGAGVAAFGAAIILASRSFHPILGAHFGPGFFPTIIGAGMILGGILLVIEAMQRGDAAEAAVSSMPDAAAERTLDETRHKPRLAALAWVMIGTVAAIWLLPLIGFVAYATLLLGGMMLLLGVRFVPALALALPLSAGVYLVFVHLLLVPLPIGDVFLFLG